jgi:paraquat-inducible protein A
LILTCGDCGTLQRATAAASVLTCGTCRNTLERRNGRGLDVALATAGTAFLLLWPANLLPLLSIFVAGISQQSLLITSAYEVWSEGWPLLAVMLALLVVVLPLLRFALLTAVLTALWLGRRPSWLGRAFRVACALSTWAMPDVFLLGLWIAYARLAATLQVSLGTGGLCLVGAGLAALFTRATLDEPAVWRMIRSEGPLPADGPVLSCESCEAVLPTARAGERCPRCARRLHTRKVDATARAAALTAAGVLLYLPANLYQMATIPVGLRSAGYTVLQGVLDLADVHLYALAALVFTVSFAIPLLKLAGMGWFCWAVARRSRYALKTRTKLYRVVEEIGRWSMVDPFTIACFVPVMQINAEIYGRAGPAATAFTGVVVLTMAAAKCFDPRVMWDAAEARR